MKINGTNFTIRSLNGLQKYLKGRGITYTDKNAILQISANEAGVERDRLPLMIGRKY